MVDTNDSVEEENPADSQENKAEESEEDNQEETQENIPDDYEPPVRKTPFDYIRERKVKRIEKTNQEGVQNEVELTPEANRALEARLEPYNQYLNEKDISLDIKLFLADPENKDFKRYDKIASKFMKNHPTLTVEQAFYLAGQKDLMSIGANRAKEAENRIKRSSLKGGTSRRLEKTNLDFQDPKTREMLDKKLAHEGKIDFEELVG